MFTFSRRHLYFCSGTVWLKNSNVQNLSDYGHFLEHLRWDTELRRGRSFRRVIYYFPVIKIKLAESEYEETEFRWIHPELCGIVIVL